MLNLRIALRSAILAVPAAAISLAAAADPVADFYKGQTFTVYIGGSAGGGYDFYGRALARFLGRNIPGKPDVLAINKPGAGTLLLANWLYTVGPKDGSAMGHFGRGLPVQKMLGKKGVKIDGNKYQWIGSMNKEVSVCILSSHAKVKNFGDLLKTTAIVGGTGRTSNNVVFATFLKNRLGAKLRIIAGYPGTRQATLAMERKEIDGICGWSWSSVMRQKRDWWEAGRMNVLVQMSWAKHPDLPNAPLITELARDDREKAMMKVLFKPETAGRPFAVPPGVPKARVQALRRAFDATMKDPAFKAYAKKIRMEYQWISGEEVQALFKDVLATPPDIIALVKDSVSTKGKLEKAKLSYVTAVGKVVEIKRKGRRISIMYKGKKVKTKVSGSRTRIFVDGKKVKRKKVKMGMMCTFTYLGPGSESKKIDCKS